MVPQASTGHGQATASHQARSSSELSVRSGEYVKVTTHAAGTEWWTVAQLGPNAKAGRVLTHRLGAVSYIVVMRAEAGGELLACWRHLN